MEASRFHCHRSQGSDFFFTNRMRKKHGARTDAAVAIRGTGVLAHAPTPTHLHPPHVSSPQLIVINLDLARLWYLTTETSFVTLYQHFTVARPELRADPPQLRALAFKNRSHRSVGSRSDQKTELSNKLRTVFVRRSPPV